MARPIAITTTTIRIPEFLNGMTANIIRYGHQDRVAIYVIGDEKTPPGAADFCTSLTRTTGIPVRYFDLPAQEAALSSYPKLLELVPHNSGVRKLLGNFIAYRDGCEKLIMVDDDNFATDIDFVGFHAIVGETRTLDLVSADSGWFNVYAAVVEERNIPIFPRGYPWRQRKAPAKSVTRERRHVRIAVNSGLVLEDPDVDAITRLFWPIRVVAMRSGWPTTFGLAPDTWCAFNNQNTALAREQILIHFTPHATGRNADIWTSYVMCKLASAMGEAIAYGYPLVKQFRNPHDYWRDLEMELVNNRATDRFVELLREIPLKSRSYVSMLGELLGEAIARVDSRTDIPNDERRMMREFFSEYLIWQHEMERAAIS